MNERLEKLVTNLNEMSPRLRAISDEFKSYWGSDESARALLFGDFGRETTLLYKENEIPLMKKVLEQVELEAQSGDNYAETIICTIFLEAFWNSMESTVSDKGREEAAGFLGRECRDYLQGWSDAIGAPFP